jgi:hypothetical protein
LWVATRDRKCVDAGSDRNGRLGASYGLAAAAVQIDEQVAPGRVREKFAEEICKMAMDGELKSFDYSLTPPKELPPITWMKLMIDFDAGMPFVRWHDDRNISTACRDLRFFKANVLKCFPAIAETSTTMPPKRGTKMKYDWPDARDFVFKEMNQKGQFREWDRESEWRCQADLERLVMTYMKDKPSVSTVRVYVSKFLKEWCARQTSN